MSAPYTYTDIDGDKLEVTSPRDGSASVFLYTPGRSARVTREHLPDVVHAMYRAAGIDPFFLLPSGTPPLCRHEGHGVTIQPSPDNRPGNVPGVFLRTRADTTRLMCGEARHIAWHLMLHAQQAEDASEVKPKTNPADAARITSFFADATEEEIAGFLARFEITERAS